MVVEDYVRDGAILESLFTEFANMSGLEINIPEIVLIPLFKNGATQDQQYMNRPPSSNRKHIKVCGEGTYLGFNLGNEKNQAVWDAHLT